jgi:hypothetical protein
MAPIRGPARALCTFGSALLILTGCDKLTHSEADFARAALERNPDLTIVAADKDANTFTVQVKGSTELRVVRVDQIIGGIPSDGSAPKVLEPASSTASSQPTESSGEPGTAAASPGEPASADTSSSARSDGTPTGSGVIRDSKGNVIASVGPDGVKSPSTSAQGGESSTVEAAPLSGRVLASGPGYTITAGDPRAARPIRLAEATVPKSPVNVERERRYEPMVCQGSRLLHIDGRNLEFEGDAVRALDGCEIHITNSHIIAHGTGISARAANVYVKNSIIEGDSGSVSASDGAKVYTQQSTFKGLSRRLDTATFTDLGGTTWD